VYQSQPEYQTGMLVLINAFQAAYPNVKTEWVSSSINLTEAIAAGTLPDIFIPQAAMGWPILLRYQGSFGSELD
jgi:ABC-type glycerol-3-phosphate transport system substrate-binding protein